MTRSKTLVILGFGGHARSVADVALATGYLQLLFVDENANAGENFFGHPVVARFNSSSFSMSDAFAASGDNLRRAEQCMHIENLGLNLISLVSPLASVGIGSSIAAGCFVGHHAHVGPMATIGRGCIINTGAIVEHEARLGDFSHVAVNATIAGRSGLGAYSMLGAGATLIDGVLAADGVTVGAGSVVTSSIDEPGVYVGVPVRRIK